ncbi:hypothetical protein ABXN37_01925 [Piscinibacter sakaiensis]|uniref:Outer membrane lipoprotein-sorting protein n=1 Tax=Piscinibacter sakaiensis TaxID=1547922 RepID=A0A0K8NU43_PISS1|nr:hypothetical protein [Piscinibacter sakaiensis]GAP33931.1 hypothetical protein ISF6_1709 [Piscinibacter sakaiensis]
MRPILLTLALPALCAALGAALPAPASAQPAPPAAASAPDYSEAEKLLFMGRAMRQLKPPTTLSYAFRHSGSLEPAFDDRVRLRVQASSGGGCCRVDGEFLGGQRRLELPGIEDAEANPVLLFFLERDVREMQRLTKGSQNYYRKRIRLAAYQGARIGEVSFRYQGRAVSGRQIDLAPYDDDPARVRYERHALKTYRFVLSDAVPGGFASIRSEMRDPTPGATAPLIVEELTLDGVELLPSR